jgi:hypothetical protein
MPEPVNHQAVTNMSTYWLTARGLILVELVRSPKEALDSIQLIVQPLTFSGSSSRQSGVLLYFPRRSYSVR